MDRLHLIKNAPYKRPTIDSHYTGLDIVDRMICQPRSQVLSHGRGPPNFCESILHPPPLLADAVAYNNDNNIVITFKKRNAFSIKSLYRYLDKIFAFCCCVFVKEQLFLNRFVLL